MRLGQTPPVAPTLVDIETLRRDGGQLASRFQAVDTLRVSASKIAEILKGSKDSREIQGNLKAVFSVIKPSDLQNKPLLIQTMQQFLDKYPSANPTIVVSGLQVNPLLAHVCSPSIAESIGDYTPENAQQAVEALAFQIDRIDPDLKKMIFDFFQKGTVQPTFEQLPKLLAIGDQIHIPGLLRAALDYYRDRDLLRKLDLKQLFQFLEFATSRNLGELQLKILHKIRWKKIHEREKPASWSSWFAAPLTWLAPSPSRLSALSDLYDQNYSIFGNDRCSISNKSSLEALMLVSKAGLRIENIYIKYLDSSSLTICLKWLKEINSLDSLTIDQGLDRSQIVLLAEVLKGHEGLKTVCLEHLLDDFGAAQIAVALKTHRTLTVLNVGNNKIGPEGAKQLAEALAHNRTLISLQMHNNQIGDAGAHVLATALLKHPSLTHLGLSNNNIQDTGMSSLSAVVSNNKLLASLDLSGAEITDEGFIDLAEALKKSDTLIELNLSGRLQSRNNMNALLEALKTNKSVISLDLSCNYMTDEDVRLLAQIIETHPLQHLDLSRNDITDRGIAYLAEALKKKTCLLKSLDVGICKGTEEGVKALLEALKVNTTLITLGLQLITTDRWLEINNALGRNKALQ